MLIVVSKVPELRQLGRNSAVVEVISDGDYDDIDWFVQNDPRELIETILVFDRNMRLTEVCRFEQEKQSADHS